MTNGLVLYQTRPSGLVSFSSELGNLVGSSHGGQRIPISRREADSHLTGFAWHYLTEFCWPNIAEYYPLAKEQEYTVSSSFLNLASVKKNHWAHRTV
jgi:hypothetical protein